MKFIRNWFYGRAVCKKYGLIFKSNPIKDGGTYDWWNSCISADISSKYFKSIVLHEIGHHVHHKRVDYNSWLYQQSLNVSCTHGGHDVIRSMQAETFASRFALKTGNCDRDFLLRSFKTYSAVYLRRTYVLCKHGVFESILDEVYKSIRKLEK